jgi:nitroimidazol reductase NimA-like FMN-containing flavoprotein (pyridoxamine 5'-phosphate oxidase superfamily)
MAELKELTYAECRALLVAGEAGRVAVSTPDGPHIIPLNYSVVDESIVFRTSPFSVLATYGRNTKLAFEVDHVRDEVQRGWSVVVRGRADVITDPAELAHIRQICPPVPWADGTRNLYFRLALQEVTGRSLGHVPYLDLDPVDVGGPGRSAAPGGSH